MSVVSTKPGGEASISSQSGSVLDILFSDSDSDSEVKVIKVSDEGSTVCTCRTTRCSSSWDN